MTDPLFAPTPVDSSSDKPTPDGPFDRQVDPAVLAQIDHELAAVERAIRSLDAGTYGHCEVCQGPIDPSVLERDPIALRCGAHG
jgi:DnaK suppressor protein